MQIEKVGNLLRTLGMIGMFGCERHQHFGLTGNGKKDDVFGE